MKVRNLCAIRFFLFTRCLLKSFNEYFKILSKYFYNSILSTYYLLDVPCKTTNDKGLGNLQMPVLAALNKTSELYRIASTL